MPIAEGDSVYLAYVSGNRDEEVFDDPFRFDVGRDPNKHCPAEHAATTFVGGLEHLPIRYAVR